MFHKQENFKDQYANSNIWKIKKEINNDIFTRYIKNSTYLQMQEVHNVNKLLNNLKR